MKKWNNIGGDLYLRTEAVQISKLENKVYGVGQSIMGFYLYLLEDKFSFDYKIYGLETALVSRVAKTYSSTSKNLGVMLNGLKGTGKTVSSKIMCNEIKQPTIVVDKYIEEIHTFLNSIPQNITIFIDEYEKIFKDSSHMLTIMDGAMNSEYKRLFILTTNDLYVNQNLLQRPGRIRYLKTFSDLSPEVVEEIIDDKLKHKKFKAEIIKFVSNLKQITVDIVSSIIEEVNIHNESPSKFEDVFNVSKITGKFNVYRMEEGKDKFELFKKNVEVHYLNKLDDKVIGNTAYIDGEDVGIIQHVINRSTAKVVSKVGKSKKIKVCLYKVEDAYMANYSYKYNYDDFGSYMGGNGNSHYNPRSAKSSSRKLNSEDVFEDSIAKDTSID